MNLDKYEKLSIGLIVSTFLLSLGATVSLGVGYFGSDVYYHLEIVYEFLQGKGGGWDYFVLSHAGSPYPPIFHFLLLPFVAVGLERFIVNFFQVFFYTGIVALVIWFVQKYASSKASFFSGLFLLSSVPFTDSIMQVRPQSFFMLLLVPLLYFYIEGKKNHYTLTVISMLWSWSIAPVFFIYGLVLSRLKDRKWIKSSILIIISGITLAIFVWYFSDFSHMIGRWGGHMDSLQERLIWEQPLTTIPIYFGSLVISIPIFISYLFRWKSQPSWVKTVLLVLSTSLVLLPIWTDRWLQVSSILLSTLSGNWLSQKRGFWYGAVLTLAVLYFTFWTINYWFVTFTGNWYSAGSNQWWGAP